MDVPRVIAGRFRIEREIGTGGMGTVYLATHLDLERPVAVKIIRREFAGDADVADRFLREARTMAKLHHQHAAMIFDAGSLPDGRHFIVMEFVEGETLSQALAREGRFPASKAVNIATQICEVLEEAQFETSHASRVSRARVGSEIRLHQTRASRCVAKCPAPQSSKESTSKDPY